MSKRSANDELLGKVLASHDPAMQELNFLNTVLGFLSRKTKFLENPTAASQINSIVKKHVEKAKQKQKKKAKKNKNQPKSKTSVAATKSAETEETGNLSEAVSLNENESKNEANTTTSVGTGTTAGTQMQTEKESDSGAKSVETGVGTETPMEIDTTTEGKDDSGNEDEDDGEKPEGNGGRTDKYVWTQTLEEVEMKLDIPKEKSGKDCIIKFSDRRLKISLKGETESILDGELHDKVDADDCSWTLDEEYGKATKTLTIVLTKSKGMNWWSRVIVGDAQIDTKKIEPANSKLDDLEPDVRQTVEKMMFDQRAKAMGKPTSKELEQQKILEKFKAQHPEMDFSNVKFG